MPGSVLVLAVNGQCHVRLPNIGGALTGDLCDLRCEVALVHGGEEPDSAQYGSRTDSSLEDD